jgi:hypothetical protein
MIDYVSLMQSAMDGKGSFDELPDENYYELMIRGSYDIDLSHIRQYIVYEVVNNHHRDILIKRPKSLWERTKLMIKLTTIVLGVKKHGK